VALVRKLPGKQSKLHCVAMKRRAQRKIMAATDGMSVKAEIAYFERHADEGPFQELRRRIRKGNPTPRAAKRRKRGS
jgi:hypothetical protein